MAYPGRILMLTESAFPEDPRVRREAYTLTKLKYKVCVICLNETGTKFRENVNGVNVYRVPQITIFKKTKPTGTGFLSKAFLTLKTLLGYLTEYSYFTVIAFIISLFIFFKYGFDVVHAHNPPDTLFIIGAFYKLFGKKFVFDHHDLSPELYLSRYNKNNGAIYEVLKVLERLSCFVADKVIATNESYRTINIERNKVNPENIFIVRNGPDLDKFKITKPDKNLKSLNKKILVYVGCMNPQDGIDYLLKSLWHLAFDMKRTDFYCVLIGTGDSLEDLKHLAEELNLNDYVLFTGFISDEDLIRYLSTADICVDPDPSSPLNDVSTWIKIMEYMAFGKPIVSFDLKETRFTAQNSAIYVPPNEIVEFANGIAKLMDDDALRKKMGDFGRKRILESLSWDKQKICLEKAYKSIENKSL